jgi:hypothetical protein
VAQFDGNEHVYFFHQYYLEARRAGFHVSLPGLARGASKTGVRGELRALAGRAWRQLIRGDAPLVMDCRKPG